jgi:carbamate kinase
MKILVALGGNAILQRKQTGTAEEQLANIRRTSYQLVDLFKHGAKMTITHGNGPQVGDILLRNELSKGVLPPMPLDICGAESQGMIGYMLQQSLDNELKMAGYNISIVTVLTQTIVDKDDPAFGKPTKPIGPFYSEKEAEKLRVERNWVMIDDAGKGYRRVVPSPKPRSIVEAYAIKKMFDEGFLILHSGGGGIPVIRKDDGSLAGVEAVIDKDLTASLIASLLKLDVLLILTDVERLALNYGKPDQMYLDSLSVGDAKKYLKDGQFPPGSMGPKVEAGVGFVESGGSKAIIASLNQAEKALEGRAGTMIS